MAYTRADKERGSLPAQHGTDLRLQGINIDDMVFHLELAMQDTSPRHFFDGWRKSRKITMSKDRIDSIMSYAEKIMQANQVVTQTQAELRVAPLIVESIVRGQFEKAQQEIALQAREHFDQMQEIDDRAEARSLQLTMLFLQVELIQARIGEIKAIYLADEALARKIDSTTMTGADIANIFASRQKNAPDISDELATLTQQIELLNADIAIKKAEVENKLADANIKKAAADSAWTQANKERSVHEEAMRKKKEQAEEAQYRTWTE